MLNKIINNINNNINFEENMDDLINYVTQDILNIVNELNPQYYEEFKNYLIGEIKEM